MKVPDRAAPSGARLLGIDRSFLLLVLGSVMLILIGLISIPLMARRTPSLAPANTPAGTVQRFYQAAYGRDWAAAYRFLSSATQQQLTLSELQQQLSGELKNSHMVVSNTSAQTATATVDVTITNVQSGGPFNTGEYSSTREVLLQREGSDWKIISGPFYVQPKR